MSCDPSLSVSPAEAAALMQERGEATVSLLQRHYGLGYRAALALMERVNLAGVCTIVAQQPTPVTDLGNLRRFADAVRTGLGPTRLSFTGATLYSQPFSLARGNVFIMGTNPGGTDEGKSSIAAVLARLEQGEDAGNDYLDDQTWDTPQSLRLQKTVRALLHLLAPGRERSVCAANLVLVRSRTVEDLNARTEGFWTLADACWPGHEVILDVVRPKLIVAYGNGPESAYEYLLHRFRQTAAPERDECAGWGSTKLKAFNYAAHWGDVRVVGLPHPSRYGLLGSPSDGAINRSAGEPWPILRPNVADFVLREPGRPSLG